VKQHAYGCPLPNIYIVYPVILAGKSPHIQCIYTVLANPKHALTLQSLIVCLQPQLARMMTDFCSTRPVKSVARARTLLFDELFVTHCTHTMKDWLLAHSQQEGQILKLYTYI
jgi:hypothetical protein